MPLFVIIWPLLLALISKAGAAAATIGKVAGGVGTAAKGLLGAGGEAAASAAPAAGAELAKTAAVTPAIATPPPTAPPPSTGGGGLLGMGGGGKPPPAPGGGLQNLAKQSMVQKGGGAISLPAPGGPSQGPPGGPGGLARGQIELPDTGGPRPMGGPGGGPDVPDSQGMLGGSVPPADNGGWLMGAKNLGSDIWGQTPPGQFMNAIGDAKAAWQNPNFSGGRKAFETARPMLRFGLEQAMGGGGGGGGGPSGQPPPGRDEMEDYARQQMMSRAGSLGSQSPVPDWRRRLEEMQRQRLGQGGY